MIDAPGFHTTACSRYSRSDTGFQAGFTLLEVLVALVIMAFALGILYQAVAGSVGGVREAVRFTEAGLVAQSLLDGRTTVPVGGWNDHGERQNGLIWSVKSSPYMRVENPESALALPLQRVEILLEWPDSKRTFKLVTLLPEQRLMSEPR